MTSEPRDIPELPRADGAERDGIGEEDHGIPLWFNASFAATVVFAVLYAAYYLLSGWSAGGQYAAEVERAEAHRAAARASLPATNPFRGDAAALAEGKLVFEQICSACHKPDGSGLVGPSLVDPYWKYGSSDPELFTTVSEGRPAGMPAWGQQLGSEKIWKALLYLEKLPHSDVPGIGAPGVAGPLGAGG
jgi:cytochrome c oxidase cbb3-type subunit 3